MYELINNVPLKIKEYKGQRVVTFRDIDTVHGRPEGTAKKRFNDNRKHFIEGEDYFKVCWSEIRTNKIMDISPKVHRDIIFLTENGYLMLVKSLTDDLSWEVQRQLVKTYFRVQEINSLYAELIEILRNEINSGVKETIDTELDKRFRAVNRKIRIIAKALDRHSERTIIETTNSLIPFFDILIKRLYGWAESFFE